jgi:4'-phosphopantetheinyl transferase EntD
MSAITIRRLRSIIGSIKIIILALPGTKHTQSQLLDAAAIHLREWFGPAARVVVSPIDGTRPMHAEEEAHVRRAVARRRDEFSTGRWCARHALAELGEPAAPIPVGPFRNPIWPAHLTGSITHTTDTCAAVVAPRSAWTAIGIDLLDREAAATLPPEADRLISHRGDQLGAPADGPAWLYPLALVFSAKEAAIKALSPRAQRLVDFPEIRLRLDRGTFVASFDAERTHVAGWWTTVQDKLILAAAAMR